MSSDVSRGTYGRRDAPNFHPLSFRTEIDEPPESKAAILKWAQDLGLHATLARPAIELLPWLDYGYFPHAILHGYTIEEALRGRSVGGGFDSAILLGLRGLLGLAAQHARLDRERRVRWAAAPEPLLAPFAKLAMERLQELRANEKATAPVFLRDFGLHSHEAPPVISADFPDGRYGPTHVAQVFLVGHERGFLSHHCDCSYGREPCGHLRVLFEAVLDTIFGPPSRLKTWMIETLGVPTWQRQLDAISRAHASGTNTRTERIVWRVGALGRTFHVQPVLQKMTKSGRWSTGRKVTAEVLRRTSNLSHEDRIRADILLLKQPSPGHGLSGPWAVKFLEGLVDIPTVYEFDPPHPPLRVQRTPAKFALQPSSDGLEVCLQIGETRLFGQSIANQLLDETHGALLRESVIHLFEIPDAARPLIEATAIYPARIPSEGQSALLDVVTALSSAVDVQLPESIAGRVVPAAATPILRLTPEGEGLKVEVRIRPVGTKDFPVADGPQTILHQDDGERVSAARDFDEERAAARGVAEQLGLEPLDAATWHLPNAEAALDVVHSARALDDDIEVQWPASERWETVSPTTLRVKVERSADWFGVGGGLEVDGKLLALATLLSAVRAGQRYVQVGPHKFARIEAELAATARRLDDVTYERKGRLSASLAALDALDEFADEDLDCDKAWLELRARMRAARNLSPRTPSKLQADLRPYQKEGFRWLARMSAWDAGACLADDMGLGKTLQTLAVLLHRQQHGPALVVAPTSVGPNWVREAERFTPSLRVRHYYGPGRNALLEDLGPGDLLITSYSTMTIDAEALRKVRFDTLVLDEAQAIKNARTQRARAARGLDARWRVALSGTPVENHLGELWAIFSVISPGLLGPWEHFRERFAGPIEREGDQTRLEALSRLVRPFILRRTKAKVAPELPPRTEVLEPVELSRDERALYEVTRQQALAELVEGGAGDSDKIQILAALTRLRRLACHARLVHPDFAGASSKIDVLLEHLLQLKRAGQRALIFSQFTSFLELVRSKLDGEGLAHLYLDGKTPTKRRGELVDRWAEGDVDLFLISLKAGGSGLNLTGADYVFHLDPWWNPAVEDQATDRTHRIGQERPVTVVRLIAQATIEEAVLSLHEEKRALADGLLSGTEAAGKLTSAQLIDLIRIGEGDGDGESESLEAPEPAPSPTPRRKRSQRKPPSRKADAILYDAADLDALGADLAADLDDALGRHQLADSTAESYLKVFENVVDFAQEDGGSRTLRQWRDLIRAAYDEGRIRGSAKVTVTVLNRARRVASALLKAKG